jgi:hypothetical protein
MVGLGPRDLLDLSESGASLDWISRGLLLVSSAWPEASVDQCAALPLGTRDRLVLALRMQTLGREMALRSRCRACGTDLVAQIDLGAVLAAHAAGARTDVAVELGDEVVQARLPSSDDLLAIRRLPPGDGEWALYERCLTSTPSADPALVRQRVSEAIAAADPLIALEIEFECNDCHQRHAEPFDIVSSFWKEIDAGAARTALDVHALASEYGWSEDQILAMTAARRARYRALRDR